MYGYDRYLDFELHVFPYKIFFRRTYKLHGMEEFREDSVEGQTQGH